MIKIFPSLMAADQLNLEHEVKKLEAYCNGFHIDIIDSHFAPNIGLSPATTNQLDAITDAQLSIHLMVEQPNEIIEALELKKNDIVSFHLESTHHPEHIIEQLHKKNLLAGIALRPSTPLEKLYPHLPHLDNVLVMTVEPGFSGQALLPDVLKKIEMLINYKKVNRLFQPVAVDGGVTKDNIKHLADLGVEIVAVGSAIFDAPDQVNALQELYKYAQN